MPVIDPSLALGAEWRIGSIEAPEAPATPAS